MPWLHGRREPRRLGSPAGERIALSRFETGALFRSSESSGKPRLPAPYCRLFARESRSVPDIRRLAWLLLVARRRDRGAIAVVLDSIASKPNQGGNVLRKRALTLCVLSALACAQAMAGLTDKDIDDDAKTTQDVLSWGLGP